MGFGLNIVLLQSVIWTVLISWKCNAGLLSWQLRRSRKTEKKKIEAEGTPKERWGKLSLQVTQWNSGNSLKISGVKQLYQWGDIDHI